MGAVAGLVYFYFSEGKQIANITSGKIIKSMLVGGFLEFFITTQSMFKRKMLNILF